MAGPWHLVTGEYPPQLGGVSDYTAAVARALAAAGDAVHVWAPAVDGAAMLTADLGVTVHRLPGAFGDQGLRDLERQLDAMSGPRTVLVQYVPHAFGSRGMNLRFSRWVQHRARDRRDDVRVMFHEPYYPFTLWPPHLNVLAAANRLMAVLLLSDIRVAYVSTTAWQRRLSKYAPRTRQFVWLPIPSSIPVADAAATVRWRERLGGPGARVVGHFGTFGRLVSRLLGPALVRLLEQRSDVSIALIGPDGDAFAAELCTGRNDWRRRIFATGRLDAAEVAGCIAACDLMLQPYADGASGRRTTLMAAMVNGKATVTNRGAATEAVWDGSDAVCFAASRRPSALVSAVERLLDDDGERERVGAAGATLYARQFALAHSIRILRGDREGAA